MLNTNGSPWPIAHSRSPSPASSTPAIATTHQRESRAPGAAPRGGGAVISAADARAARGSRSEVSSEGTDEGGHPGANPRSVPEEAAYQGPPNPTGLNFSLRVANVMPRNVGMSR